MTEEKRPGWTHSISEVDARWLAAGFITKIEHKWKMTGADTSEDWIELTCDKTTETRRFPSGFLNTNGYFAFKPNWRELVTPTYKGEQAIKDIEAIDAWEKKHQRERAEYERLRAKYEPLNRAIGEGAERKGKE